MLNLLTALYFKVPDLALNYYITVFCNPGENKVKYSKDPETASYYSVGENMMPEIKAEMESRRKRK